MRNMDAAFDLQRFVNAVPVVDDVVRERGGDSQAEQPWGNREVQGETWKKVRRLYSGSKGSRSPARRPSGPMSEYDPQE